MSQVITEMLAGAGDLELRTADPTGLLNKYALPKVAMVVIAVAAALGSWLTVGVGEGRGGLGAATSYMLLMASGTAAGGLFWRWYVVESSRLTLADPRADAYARRQVEIFQRMENWAWPVSAAALVWLAPYYLAAPQASQGGEHAALVAAFLCLATWGVGLLWDRRAPGGVAAGRLSLPAAAGLLAAFAWLQVWHDYPAGYGELLLWRILHLFAFAAWFGGAVWNVAVAVRAARADLNLPVVLAAHLQLERFRRVVRVALPLILVTGLFQAHDFFGWDAGAAVHGTFGQLLLVKLGLIGVLLVIFNTCPMWHACSPIAGMCSLDDLPSPRGRPVHR